MINQSTVEQALLKWMQEFVESPHPSLGNWPPCPYARQARLSNNILIKPGVDPYTDGITLLSYDWSKEVVIFWYEQIDPGLFVELTNKVNAELLKQNIVILEDHPEVVETVSGVTMNFGVCPIIVCQKLDKLNQAADQLRAKGYYDTWNQAELDNIVTWRYH